MRKGVNKKNLLTCIASLLLCFVCALFINGGVYLFKQNNNSSGGDHEPIKILTIDNSFEGSQYVVANGNVYEYLVPESQKNSNQQVSATLQSLNPTISLTPDKTFQLIFLKDTVNMLSAYTVENNISSIFTVEKQNDDISIALEYPNGNARAIFSSNSQYVLGSLALNVNTSLKFANGEFMVGETKNSTSFATTATTGNDAMILHLIEGHFSLIGDVSYSPAENESGRAIWVEGGELTVEDATFTNFDNDLSGSVLLNSGKATLTNVNMIENTGSTEIISNSGELEVNGGEYSDNTLTFGGGGHVIRNMYEDWSNGYPPTYIYGTSKITNAVFKDNFSKAGSSIIWVGNNASTVTGCEFTNNEVNASINSSSNTIVSNCTFNLTGSSCGVIGSATITDTEFNNIGTGTCILVGSEIIINDGLVISSTADYGIRNDYGSQLILNAEPSITVVIADIYLDSNSYITVNTTLTAPLSVYKDDLTCYDEDTSNSSVIAYSTDNFNLASAEEYITVVQYQDYNQHSIIMKDDYLVCEYKSYTATFDGNGGSNGASITTKYTFELGTLPTSSRVGYIFNGWFTEKDGGTQISSTTTMPANDITYYAQWTAIKYEVKFNGNSSTSGSMSNQTFTYDVSQALTANAFKRAYVVTLNTNGGTCSTSSLTANYTFAGWATSESGEVVYADKASVKNLRNTAGTYNLYAKWTSTSVTLPTPTKTGYTFNGWNTAENGTGTSYAAGASYTPSTTTTLYAQWTAIKYEVKFNGNSSTSGSMSNQTFTYDVSQALTANAFKRAYVVTLNTNGGTCSTSSLTANYTFAGWATSESGEVVYADKASVKNLRNTAGTYNLYAKWTSTSVTLPTPTKTGYTFNGWNTAENGTGTSYAAGASYTPSTTTTLYAQWTAIKYEVKFNGNSSTSGSMSNQTFTYDVSQALTANAFKRAYVVTLNTNGGTCSTSSLTANYTFAGWATSTSGDVVYADKASVKNLRNTAGTYNLYAKWTSASVTLPTPTKTGYTFNAWNTAENGTGTSYAGGENYTPVAAITLYAQWTINKYSVSIVASNADYGSVSVSTVENVPYGTTIKVGASTNILLVNGTEVIASSTDNTAQYTYNFSKWTQGSTSGTVVSTTGVTVTGAVTIYANFTRELNSYKVTIEPSPSGYGSVSSTSVVSVPYGTSITANGATLTIHTSSAISVSATAGDTTAQYTYAFSKWTQGSTSGAQVTSSGFTVSGAVTIYANFTRTLRSYAVNILIGQSGYGGVSSATVASVPYGTSITASGAVLTIHAASETTITATPTTATAQYTYSFSKWTQNSANGTQINSTGFNTTGETTIYANFGRTLNTYNVNIVVSPSGYGGVNVETIENVPYGSTVKVGTSANLLSVNGTVVTATATSKTGYTRTFSKWAKNSASGTQVTTTGFTTAGEETVYAIFSQSANTYTIAYDYAGGTKGSNAPANGTYDNGITISNPTRTGYAFTGWTASGLSTSTAKYGTSNSAINSAWSDEETKVTATYFKNLRTTSGTVTLTANWSAVSYKIAFAGGGATGGSTADQTLTYDVATALTANGFTRAYKVTFNANGGTCGTSSLTANYSFAGWKSSVAAGTYGSTSSACTTAVTTSAIIGNKYYVKNLAVNGTVTFTAQWNSASVTLPTPTRTGYTFNGWNTASDGSGTSYASGASYTPSAATTLYAQWTANTYTIKFNGNGATGGSTADQTITYDVATALTANGFTRAYKVTFNANSGTCSTSSLTATYSFNGWKSSVATGTYGSTSAACTTAVTTSAVINNKYYVKNLAASGSVTFTAQWTSASVTLPTPTRTGYTFNGWYTAATDGTKVGGAGESYTPSAATTLYAQWTINTYTVTLTKDGGISSVSGAGTYTYGETVTLGATAATGYLFSKWTGYAESTTNAYSFEMPAQNVTLKANSSAQTYTITYAANNGTLTGTAGTDYTKTYNITGAITLPTTTYISRTGYTFGGWKVTTAGGNWKTTDSAYSESVAAGKYGNVTLTAQWTAIQYAIKFNGNGATSGSMSNQTHTYDASLALTANAFKRAYVVTFNANGGTCGTSSLTANYTFAGWATSTGGSVAYADKASVKNLRNTAGTYNLYAKWTSASVTLPTPTKTGYTFNGWNTAQNGSGTSYNAGASYTPTAAITLYAQWTANQYTITWNGNATAGDLILSELWNYAGSAGYTSSNTGSNSSYTEKSGVTAKSKVTYDSAASYKTPIPIRRGYSFNGWYTAATNGTKIADNAGNFIASVSGYTGSSKQWIKAANTTLYAQYTANTYDITIDNAGGSGPSDTTYSTASGATIAAPTRTGYTFNGWNVIVSLNKMNNATIGISDGTQQYSASYPDAVYYELFYLKSNISYTGVKGNDNIRWRTYNATTGEFIGNACSDVTFTGNDTNLAFWYHTGNSSATTTISFIVGTGEFKTSDYKLTGDVALTARWSINKYTVSIVVGQSGYGSVSTTSIANVPYNSTIKVGSSANILSVNGTNVTATATAQTAQYSYAFSKWTQSSATGTQVTTAGFTVTGAITIYANFTRSTRTYTVTIAVGQSGYGTVSSSSVTAVPYGTKITASGGTLTIAKSTAATVTATATAATGYTTTFSKWTQSSTTGTQVTSTGFTTTGAITIYANFSRSVNSYTISYNYNGGAKGTNSPASGTYDSVVTISNPTRTGYAFAGWTASGINTSTAKYGTSSSSVTTAWSNASTKVTATYFKNLTPTSGGAVTLTAQWTAVQTSITLDKQGGDGGTSSVTGTYNGAISGITIPTKEGYTFDGYYSTSSNDTGYQTNNIQLWYDGIWNNGYGNATSTTTTSWKDLAGNNNGTLYNFAAGMWSGNGLVFDGVDSYVNGISNMTISNTTTWEIVYKTASSVASAFLIDQRINNVGYQPAYISSSGVQFYDSITGNTSYTSYSAIDTFVTLTIVKNGTTVSVYANGTLIGTRTTNITSSTEGSVFLGTRHTLSGFLKGTMYAVRIHNAALTAAQVSANAKLDANRFNSGSEQIKYYNTDGSAALPYWGFLENSTLTAKWTPNVYKVTLDNQSATTAGTTEYYYEYKTTKTINGVKCYYYTTSACTTGLSGGYYITCPTKTGYTFGGYFTSTGGAGTQYVDASGGCINNLYNAVAANSTLYAKWTINTYTVTIAVGQSGYGTVSSTSVTAVPYGTKITASGGTLTIAKSTAATVTATATAQTAQYSYAFSKWTQSSTSGTQVTSTGFTVTGAITIYANFTRSTRTYTVTIAVGQSGYGTVSSTSVTAVPYGTKITASGGTLTIAKSTAVTVTATATAQTAQYSYAFSKWTLSSTTGAQVTSTGFTVTGSKTIYANFIRSTRIYTVTFAVNNANYGVVSQASITGVPYNSAITVSGNTVKINGTTVTASLPTTGNYWSQFSNWSNTSNTITAARTITANFTGKAAGLYSDASHTTLKTAWSSLVGNGVTVSGNVITGSDYEVLNAYLVIPTSITVLDDYAFDGCCDLLGVLMPDSMTAWGAGAFYCCCDMTSVTIPAGITTISDWAFEECSDLSSVTIHNKVTTIEKGAFSACSSLTSITIPNSVTTIGNSAFTYCALTSVTIPSSVTTLGGLAFGWNNLTSVNIPSSVTSIEYNPFAGNSNLATITSSSSTYTAVNNTLLHPSSKTIVAGCKNSTLPTSGYTTIGNYAFYYATGLTGTLSIPSSITTIGNYAFNGCSGLTGTLAIPSSVKSIGQYAFYSCSNITSITIPTSVTSIGTGAFGGCNAVQTLTYNASVTTAFTTSTYAFANLGSSSSTGGCTITIGGTVSAIPAYLFYGSSTSSYVHVKSLTIGSNITSVGNYAFRYATKLTSLSLPSSVTSIGNYAFYGCSNITNVTAQGALTSIGSYAFTGCSSIANYYFYNCTSVPSLGNACMVGTSSRKIYVPRTLYSSWRSATNWSTYSSYIYWSDMINYSCYYTNSSGTYIEIGGSMKYSGTGSFRYYSHQSFVVHSLSVDPCIVDDAYNTTYGLCVKIGSTCNHVENDSSDSNDLSYTVSASSLLSSNTVVASNYTDYETSQTHHNSSGFISQFYHVNIFAGYPPVGYGTVDGTNGFSLYILAGTTFTTTNTSKCAGGTIKINGKTYTAAPTANTSTYVYYFTGWSVTSGAVDDLTENAVIGRMIIAYFARYDAIEVQFDSVQTVGSVTPSVLYVASGTTVTSQSTSLLRFNDGQSARATISNTLWEFNSWTRTSIATGSTTSGAITEPTLFTASFIRSSGTITPITPLASTQIEPPLEGIDNTATTLATCSMSNEETEVETDAQEVWLDDKFRKLQEQQSTEVDFDGITFGA